MHRAPLLPLATLLPILALALAPTLSRADEGMWIPEQIPALEPRLRALGFDGDARAFADLTGHPMGAVVSLGYCSGAFVSPEGLIATNHHCVVGALQRSSTPAKNRLEEGHLAAARADELWNGPASRVYVTLSVKEVTDAMRGGLDRVPSDLERARLLQSRVKERTARCERPGVRCTLHPFFEGARWFEIVQLEIQDVRLVFAPPEAVGNYGGETDNWTWPRHAGDFAFLRAYVGPDGKPAPHAKENVPFRPERWLATSSRGASEGDLVFVAGYPGKTMRHATLREVRAEMEWALPRKVRRSREMLRLLSEVSAGAEDTEIRVAGRVRQLANGMKNAEGVLEGAARGGLLAAKAAEERALAALAERDPRLGEALRGALSTLDELAADEERTRERDATFRALTHDSTLLSAARILWRVAEERPRRDLDRDREFQARDWAKLRETLARMEHTVDLRADRALLRHALLEAARLPEGQRIAPLDAAVGLAPGAGDDAAGRAVDAFLDRLYAGTRLHDTATRLALFERRTKDLARTGDTFLALYAALRPFEARLEDEERARDGARARAGPIRARALELRAGGLLAPDANRTLRVTYGVVKGVSPRDGVLYTPQTTLAGLLAKHRPGDAEFDVPAAVREAIAAERARGEGPWVDPKLGDVPVNFLSSVDTTGGNSGSAVLNDRGELVGLLFDGTWETIASDYLYDAASTRSIQVDSRYLLWYLGAVANARHLLDELRVSPRVGALPPSPR
jgi:hypothetical protein